jgi:hypothetical protein
MKSVAATFLCVSAVVLGAVLAGAAAGQQAPAAPNDPRIGLKAGYNDAGTAARNITLVSHLPKAEGFYDPKAPAGDPVPAERDPNAAAPTPAPSPTAETPGASPAPRPFSLDFANSDLAFSKNHVFMGSFHGFTTYDVDAADRPRLLASVVCPGGQGDMSVYGHLLFMSVEATSGRVDCGTEGVKEPSSKERFRGVRIFDITDLQHPKQLAAVQTCRGSHTHTIVPDPRDPSNLYVYGSGTSSVRPGDELAGCSGADPKDDPDTSLFSIDVIKVPLAAPEKAAVVNRPRIFADPKTGTIAGLQPGGDRGPGTQPARATNQCHDITAFPEIGLAAGACSGNGILLDISDPAHPVRVDDVADKNFAYWHSATFNNDGTKVIFTDEWGGGTRPRCRATDPLNWGADAIFDIISTPGGKKMQFAGYFKMPAPQTDAENCVAHNGSLVPVPGRDIMVQGWYQGGLSVFDFTDSKTPVEIAFFDRGPIDAKNLMVGGFWSAYWYNGRIYGSEIARGIDVFKLTPSEYLTQNELDAAIAVQAEEVNTQDQTRVVWPAVSSVARAYMDQLTRTKAIQPDRVRAVNAALDRADKVRTPQDKDAAAVAAQLDGLAAQVDKDAASASGRDADRFKALASTLKGRAAKLH